MTVRRLVVFGGTGDLTGRFLLPALAALHAAGHIHDRFGLTGASPAEEADHLSGVPGSCIPQHRSRDNPEDDVKDDA